MEPQSGQVLHRCERVGTKAARMAVYGPRNSSPFSPVYSVLSVDTTDDTTDSSWRQRYESTTWGRDEVFESTEASFDRLGLNYPDRDPIRYQCLADVQ
jgi:hypothetical protein